MRFVPDVPDNADRCNCPGCVSNPVPGGELHCGRMLYREHVPRNGCECRTCPVFRAYDLAGEYYCEAPVH